MRNCLYTVLAFLSLFLFSCKEYEPFVECKVNGELILIERTVLAGYTNNGTYTTSTVFAEGENADIRLQVRGNFPAIYNCTPDGSAATIEVYRDSKLYTTAATGGEGTIRLIQAGTNLIEGYFNGTLVYDGNEQIVITDGLFSGRAY